MSNYFDSSAIGSSILGNCIAGIDPLVVCTDRALGDVKPTTFMEMGKIFEDLVESKYGKLDFWEKYFKSDLKTFPHTTAKGVKNVLDMFEGERIYKDEGGVTLNTLHQDIASGYEYNKPKKGAGRELSGKHANRHRLLDQIKAHDYRRPIMAPWWDRLEIMLERFENFKLPLSFGNDPDVYGATVGKWMADFLDGLLFQVEYFWTECGAKCRAKYDMIWIIEHGGETYAIPFDIKVTGDEVVGQKSFGAFVGNWKKHYALQSAHYHPGFVSWCAENGYTPHDKIYYLIQESDFPQVMNAWALHPDELESVNAQRREALPVIQKWIDSGKPISGSMPLKIVNRWGKEWLR